MILAQGLVNKNFGFWVFFLQRKTEKLLWNEQKLVLSKPRKNGKKKEFDSVHAQLRSFTEIHMEK